MMEYDRSMYDDASRDGGQVSERYVHATNYNFDGKKELLSSVLELARDVSKKFGQAARSGRAQSIKTFQMITSDKTNDEESIPEENFRESSSTFNNREEGQFSNQDMMYGENDSRTVFDARSSVQSPAPSMLGHPMELQRPRSKSRQPQQPPLPPPPPRLPPQQYQTNRPIPLPPPPPPPPQLPPPQQQMWQQPPPPPPPFPQPPPPPPVPQPRRRRRQQPPTSSQMPSPFPPPPPPFPPPRPQYNVPPTGPNVYPQVIQTPPTYPLVTYQPQYRMDPNTPLPPPPQINLQVHYPNLETQSNQPKETRLPVDTDLETGIKIQEPNKCPHFEKYYQRVPCSTLDQNNIREEDSCLLFEDQNIDTKDENLECLQCVEGRTNKRRVTCKRTNSTKPSRDGKTLSRCGVERAVYRNLLQLIVRSHTTSKLGKGLRICHSAGAEGHRTCTGQDHFESQTATIPNCTCFHESPKPCSHDCPLNLIHACHQEKQFGNQEQCFHVNDEMENTWQDQCISDTEQVLCCVSRGTEMCPKSKNCDLKNAGTQSPCRDTSQLYCIEESLERIRTSDDEKGNVKKLQTKEFKTIQFSITNSKKKRRPICLNVDLHQCLRVTSPSSNDEGQTRSKCYRVTERKGLSSQSNCSLEEVKEIERCRDLNMEQNKSRNKYKGCSLEQFTQRECCKDRNIEENVCKNKYESPRFEHYNILDHRKPYENENVRIHFSNDSKAISCNRCNDCSIGFTSGLHPQQQPLGCCTQSRDTKVEWPCVKQYSGVLRAANTDIYNSKQRRELKERVLKLQSMENATLIDNEHVNKREQRKRIGEPCYTRPVLPCIKRYNGILKETNHDFCKSRNQRIPRDLKHMTAVSSYSDQNTCREQHRDCDTLKTHDICAGQQNFYCQCSCVAGRRLHKNKMKDKHLEMSRKGKVQPSEETHCHCTETNSCIYHENSLEYVRKRIRDLNNAIELTKHNTKEDLKRSGRTKSKRPRNKVGNESKRCNKSCRARHKMIRFDSCYEIDGHWRTQGGEQVNKRKIRFQPEINCFIKAGENNQSSSYPQFLKCQKECDCDYRNAHTYKTKSCIKNTDLTDDQFHNANSLYRCDQRGKVLGRQTTKIHECTTCADDVRCAGSFAKEKHPLGKDQEHPNKDEGSSVDGVLFKVLDENESRMRSEGSEQTSETCGNSEKDVSTQKVGTSSLTCVELSSSYTQQNETIQSTKKGCKVSSNKNYKAQHESNRLTRSKDEKRTPRASSISSDSCECLSSLVQDSEVEVESDHSFSAAEKGNEFIDQSPQENETLILNASTKDQSGIIIGADHNVTTWTKNIQEDGVEDSEANDDDTYSILYSPSASYDPVSTSMDFDESCINADGIGSRKEEVSRNTGDVTHQEKQFEYNAGIDTRKIVLNRISTGAESDTNINDQQSTNMASSFLRNVALPSVFPDKSQRWNENDLFGIIQSAYDSFYPRHEDVSVVKDPHLYSDPQSVATRQIYSDLCEKKKDSVPRNTHDKENRTKLSGDTEHIPSPRKRNLESDGKKMENAYQPQTEFIPNENFESQTIDVGDLTLSNMTLSSDIQEVADVDTESIPLDKSEIRSPINYNMIRDLVTLRLCSHEKWLSWKNMSAEKCCPESMSRISNSHCVQNHCSSDSLSIRSNAPSKQPINKECHNVCVDNNTSTIASKSQNTPESPKLLTSTTECVRPSSGCSLQVLTSQSKCAGGKSGTHRSVKDPFSSDNKPTLTNTTIQCKYPCHQCSQVRPSSSTEENPSLRNRICQYNSYRISSKSCPDDSQSKIKCDAKLLIENQITPAPKLLEPCDRSSSSEGSCSQTKRVSKEHNLSDNGHSIKEPCLKENKSSSIHLKSECKHPCLECPFYCPVEPRSKDNCKSKISAENSMTSISQSVKRHSMNYPSPNQSFKNACTFKEETPSTNQHGEDHLTNQKEPSSRNHIFQYKNPCRVCPRRYLGESRSKSGCNPKTSSDCKISSSSSNSIEPSDRCLKVPDHESKNDLQSTDQPQKSICPQKLCTNQEQSSLSSPGQPLSCIVKPVSKELERQDETCISFEENGKSDSPHEINEGDLTLSSITLSSDTQDIIDIDMAPEESTKGEKKVCISISNESIEDKATHSKERSTCKREEGTYDRTMKSFSPREHQSNSPPRSVEKSCSAEKQPSSPCKHSRQERSSHCVQRSQSSKVKLENGASNEYPKTSTPKCTKRYDASCSSQNVSPKNRNQDTTGPNQSGQSRCFQTTPDEKTCMPCPDINVPEHPCGRYSKCTTDKKMNCKKTKVNDDYCGKIGEKSKCNEDRESNACDRGKWKNCGVQKKTSCSERCRTTHRDPNTCRSGNGPEKESKPSKCRENARKTKCVKDVSVGENCICPDNEAQKTDVREPCPCIATTNPSSFSDNQECGCCEPNLYCVENTHPGCQTNFEDLYRFMTKQMRGIICEHCNGKSCKSCGRCRTKCLPLCTCSCRKRQIEMCYGLFEQRKRCIDTDSPVDFCIMKPFCKVCCNSCSGLPDQPPCLRPMRVCPSDSLLRIQNCYRSKSALPLNCHCLSSDKIAGHRCFTHCEESKSHVPSSYPKRRYNSKEFFRSIHQRCCIFRNMLAFTALQVKSKAIRKKAKSLLKFSTLNKTKKSS